MVAGEVEPSIRIWVDHFKDVLNPDFFKQLHLEQIELDIITSLVFELFKEIIKKQKNNKS